MISSNITTFVYRYKEYKNIFLALLVIKQAFASALPAVIAISR